MRRLINKGLLITTAVIILMTPLTAEAKTVNRYITKTVSGIKRGTKLTVIKQGKTWATVSYQGQTVRIKKKFLNKEGLPTAKKAKKYIKYLRTRGPVRWHGRKYTYYSSRVLPIWKLPVKGLHVDKNGMWCDKDDYIVLGSSMKNRAKRKVFATPFGKYGKVYDTGGWSTPSTLCDVAVNW